MSKYLAGTLAAAAVCLVSWRVLSAGHDPAGLAAGAVYDVRTQISFEGHGEAVRVRTFLPRSDDRQTVRNEQFTARDATAQEERQGDNRAMTWRSQPLEGSRTIAIEYRVAGRAVRYALPGDLPLPLAVPEALEPETHPSPAIQSDHAEIGAQLDRIAPPPRTLGTTLSGIYEYAHDRLEPAPFKGTTDALTALRLGEGSCNGKSRLFVALARRAGLPARLAGGLILEEGSKKASHQWAEVWINGVWVPFCPLNGHFARIPATYLTLYRGDETLFLHSANINFDYAFGIARQVEPGPPDAAGGALPNPAAGIVPLFERIGAPADLLRILIMLPLGATVTVTFRNVVGLRIFGTFLPALIAVACRGTGLVWGLAGLAAVIALVGTVRLVLDRMNLLQTPKLAVMLTVVVLSFVGVSAAAAYLGLADLAWLSIFPIAVTTLTVERIAVTIQEEGWGEALSMTAQTAFVVAACYAAMESEGLRGAFLAFPELLLLVLAIDIWLGRWMGLRLTEYRRFSAIIRRPRHA